MSLTFCVNLKEKLSKCRGVAGMEKNKLYGILDELYGAAQALKDYGYILEQLYESYPVTECAEIKAVIECSRIYVVAVEERISEQLDWLDEVLIGNI